jgi:8-oxo-dGTP diphosphatase
MVCKKENKMEIWDILDEDGVKTGKTMVRGEKITPGDYYLAVHIWIRNSRGEYLIQKRAEDKTLWPGMWAATGGAAVSGETSMQSALREVEEELGIKPVEHNMVFISRIKKTNWFTDLWVLEQEMQLENIVMQKEEVCDVRWVTKQEIYSMVTDKEFVAYDYLESFLK